MKHFFLGHIYLELQLNEEGLKIYQHLMDKGFVKSSYIVSQVAMAYNNMRGRSSVVWGALIDIGIGLDLCQVI